MNKSTTSLMSLKEYTRLAGGFIYRRLGRFYLNYDNIGLIAYYLMRADLCFDPSKGVPQMAFRAKWFDKVVPRLYSKQKRKKRGPPITSIEDLVSESEIVSRNAMPPQSSYSESQHAEAMLVIKKYLESLTLKDKVKSYLIDFYVQGHSCEQIAEKNGVTSHAVQCTISANKRNIKFDELKKMLP